VATVLERFTADGFLDAIETFKPEFTNLVPTMMLRILREPEVQQRDLSSLRTVVHAAAICPDWVKRGWIELIGADRLVEYYSSSEAIGYAVISGTEWLDHPGSVGQGFSTEIRILDPDTREQMPTGEIGEIFMRQIGLDGPRYEYVGQPRGPITDDGFGSVGDLGYLDKDGYLFIADRRSDMLVSGGSNVYPAEVESAISELEGVVDVAVIGLPHPEWGHAVHAIVEPRPGATLTAAQVIEHCRARLAPYKLPKTVEFVSEPLRNTAGKLRRSALAADRIERAKASTESSC
jgi:bile acid-coenzyme A ligase